MDLQVKKKQKNQGPTIFSLHFLLFELRIDLEFERGTTSSTTVVNDRTKMEEFVWFLGYLADMNLDPMG